MHLQNLYPEIWLLKRENTLITLQNPVTLILIHRQNKLNSTKQDTLERLLKISRFHGGL